MAVNKVSFGHHIDNSPNLDCIVNKMKNKQKEYGTPRADLLYSIYEDYVNICVDNLSITPCSFEAWQIQTVLINDSENSTHTYIPYISGSGSVWVRKLGNKTRRADRPLNYFFLTMLKA